MLGLNVEYPIHPTKGAKTDIGSISISAANYLKIQNWIKLLKQPPLKAADKTSL